jgi:hypothetical protein
VSLAPAVSSSNALDVPPPPHAGHAPQNARARSTSAKWRGFVRDCNTLLISPCVHPLSQAQERAIPCAWHSPMKTSSDLPHLQLFCIFCVAVTHMRPRFSSAHFTIFSDGSRERLHGHNFTVAVDVQVTCQFPSSAAARDVHAGLHRFQRTVRDLALQGGKFV